MGWVLNAVLAFAVAAIALTSEKSAAEAEGMLITFNGVRLESSERPQPLVLRITAPAAGNRLPIILFSHGHRYSKDDYLPLTEYWAAHGFVVIQPNHLDATDGGLRADDPRQLQVWRTRIADLSRIIDSLDEVEAEVPALRGRLDRSRIFAAGHSFGGHTVEALIGAGIQTETGDRLDLSDPRVKAALVLAPPGGGGADLSAEWLKRAPYLNVDFSQMTKPALFIVGAEDDSPMTIKGPEWHQDPYLRSPAASHQCLIVLRGAKHYLGGVLGMRRTEVTDENPVRLRLVQEASLAYLRTLADPNDAAWPQAKAKLQADRDLVLKVACK